MTQINGTKKPRKLMLASTFSEEYHHIFKILCKGATLAIAHIKAMKTLTEEEGVSSQTHTKDLATDGAMNPNTDWLNSQSESKIALSSRGSLLPDMSCLMPKKCMKSPKGSSRITKTTHTTVAQ